MRYWPALRRAFAASALVALAACTGVDDDSSFAEQQELANIKLKNIVPLSSGSTLAKTFETVCLNGASSVEGRTAQLRAAGFVPVGGWRDGMRSFVIDTSEPMVRMSRDGRVCGVTARARTGQDAEIRKRIATWFPQATPVATSDVTKTIWLTGRASKEAIGITREARGRNENTISVALVRS